MDHNTTLAAPASVHVSALFDRWKLTHTGTISDFYKFITSPTMERDVFLSSCPRRTVHTRAAVVLYS